MNQQKIVKNKIQLRTGLKSTQNEQSNNIDQAMMKSKTGTEPESHLHHNRTTILTTIQVTVLTRKLLLSTVKTVKEVKETILPKGKKENLKKRRKILKNPVEKRNLFQNKQNNSNNNNNNNNNSSIINKKMRKKKIQVLLQTTLKNRVQDAKFFVLWKKF